MSHSILVNGDKHLSFITRYFID